MKLKASMIFTLFLLALVMVFLITAMSYPKRASVGPLAAGIPAAGLLIVEILLNLRRKTENEEVRVEADTDKTLFRSHIIAIAWIAGMLIATYIFGILLTFPFFTMAYIKVNGWSWSLSIGLGAGVFILLYVIFGLTLQVTLYQGILFE